MVSVVSHHEQSVRRNDEGANLLPLPQTARGPIAVDHIRLVKWDPVDQDLLTANLQSLPGQPDDSVDEAPRLVLRKSEYDDIASLNRREMVTEFIHQNVIANL
jgi:hypothetical protein